MSCRISSTRRTLRSDDFDRHFHARQSRLLAAIGTAMGKAIRADDMEEPDDAPGEYELVQGDSLVVDDLML